MFDADQYKQLEHVVLAEARGVWSGSRSTQRRVHVTETGESDAFFFQTEREIQQCNVYFVRRSIITESVVIVVRFKQNGPLEPILRL